MQRGARVPGGLQQVQYIQDGCYLPGAQHGSTGNVSHPGQRPCKSFDQHLPFVEDRVHCKGCPLLACAENENRSRLRPIGRLRLRGQLQDLGQVHKCHGASVEGEGSSAFNCLNLLRLEARGPLHLRGWYDEQTLRGFDQNSAERRQRKRQRRADGRAGAAATLDRHAATELLGFLAYDREPQSAAGYLRNHRTGGDVSLEYQRQRGGFCELLCCVGGDESAFDGRLLDLYGVNSSAIVTDRDLNLIALSPRYLDSNCGARWLVGEAAL